MLSKLIALRSAIPSNISRITCDEIPRTRVVSGATDRFERCVLESRSVTHTWGLKGVTPVMSATGKRTRLNVVGGISWAGEIFAQATTDAMNKLGFKAFLESMLARVPGNVVMVLDNSRLHRNAEIVKFVEETDRLEIVFLPAYAPELNPAAQARQVLVWG
jgi:hypothetical protein